MESMNSDENEMAYKSQLCADFENNGVCENGNSCNLAHGWRELRSLDNPLYKTQPCTAFDQEGVCLLQESCMFAHGDHELRDLDLSQIPAANKTSAISTLTTERETNGTVLLKPNQPNCMYFEKYGNCTKGDQCKFSHSKGGNTLNVNSQVPIMDSKYKTRLCIPFSTTKSCPNGARCTFAHGEQELNRAVGSDGQKAADNILYKIALCKNFEKYGHCILGDKCTFAHGRYELRPKGFKGDFEAKVTQNPNWKCTLCGIFERHGKCNREDCNFAHGESELRSARKFAVGMPQISPNYKTSLCKEFSRTGFCRDGIRCTFAHGPEELRGVQRVVPSSLPDNAFQNAAQVFVPEPEFVLQNRKRANHLVDVFEEQKEPVSNDLKMFAEFLEFKKFKQEAAGMLGLGASSNLSNKDISANRNSLLVQPESNYQMIPQSMTSKFSSPVAANARLVYSGRNLPFASSQSDGSEKFFY